MSTDGFPEIGARSQFRKTVGETDVTLFAGLTGDFAPQHIDEEFMRTRPQGRRIAHGALTLSLTSTAAARLCAEHGLLALSYGYDKVRFLAPVMLGQTVSVDYVVTAIDEAKRTARSEMRVSTEDGRLCMVGEHLLYCYPPGEGD